MLCTVEQVQAQAQEKKAASADEERKRKAAAAAQVCLQYMSHLPAYSPSLLGTAC